MVALLTRLVLVLRSLLKTRATLEAEILVLRQQLIVLSRKSQARARFRNADRLLLVWLYRLFPSVLAAIVIVKPETLIRWHRRGHRAYWHWKSRRRGGRPRIDREIRDLIQRLSRENPLWGAPRIHAELLMLGIKVAESTVGRYMVRTQRPPSQRELDERLGLSELMDLFLSDSRPGKNIQLPLADLLRQSIYSRLAGYPDVNDAARLSQDPTFRLIGSRKIWERGAALTSRLQSFETEVLTQEENLAGLAALNRELVARAEAIDSPRRVVLDLDSTEVRVHGRQEHSAYNGHFESTCN